MFTQTDVDNIKSAITQIAATGVAEIEINGQRTKYMSVSELYKLLQLAQADVDASSNNSAFFKVKFKNAE